MWIGICEDDAEYRTRLEKEVCEIARNCDRVTVYSNGSNLLDAIYKTAYPMDLLLLDIEMPALSGIETALELQKASPATQIVIITNFKDYALKGYEIRPSNYLIKPASPEMLRTEIDRARRIAGENIGEALQIKSRETVAFIPLKDILYIECFNYILHIHTVTNTYKYIQKLNRLSNELTAKGFCRTHRSFLVNLRHVERIDRTSKTMLLVTGQKLPVGELRVSEVLAEYSRFRQSLLPINCAPVCTGASEFYSVTRSLAGTFG